MPRSIAGSMVNALNAPAGISVHLLDVELSGGAVYLTDAAVNLNWNGQQYIASQFLSFSDIEETTDVLLNECTVQLSGVDQAVIAALLIYEYINRPAKVRRAALNENLTIIDHPFLLVSGRMDRPVIQTDPASGTCTASVQVISRWSPLFQTRAWYTNDADQQARYPGDRGFEHVHEVDEVLIWGSEGHRVKSPVNTGSGGRPWPL